MTIGRVIMLTVPPNTAQEAEHVWKTQCAPLMIRQKGCRSEKLMKSLERPGLYVSYSEWDSTDDIDRYRVSTDHKTIQSETHALQGSRAVVWCYEIID